MDEQRIKRMVRMLAASERARETNMEGTLAEATLPPQARPTRPNDILALVDANLKRPESVTAADWAKARELLLLHANRALVKINVGEEDLREDEACAMEAVIISDGTRPSFVLADGRVNPDDPFLGTWGGPVAAAEANGIETLAKAVGRIQPINGHASSFIGTGSLIDRERGLLLTNYHVIRSAQTRHGVATTRDGNRIRIDGVLEIDFIGEAESLDTNKHRIVEVMLPQDVGEVFAGNDIVVARLDLSQDAASLPEAVPMLSVRPAYANGAVSSLAVIGFPAEPEGAGGEDVDWNFVIRTLFANTFGVKRLAPGHFSAPLGSHADDQGRRAFGHEATTFGGASGALVAAWLDTSTPCFGIHFGGATKVNNYALSFAVAKDVLTPLGVKFA